MIEVEPKVYLIGSTSFDKEALKHYLIDTGNEEFLDILTGVDLMDVVSFYAKLCYRSLSLGKNMNISRTRDIANNFIGIISSGHGSVCEHSTVNFAAENVSRIETTEQIRHRTGQSVSAESGRYCFDEQLKYWVPQVMQDRPAFQDSFKRILAAAEKEMNFMYSSYIKDKDISFSEKKELTSAIRRMKPMGCAETIGFSLNLRAARHMIELRTSEHAEEEIRIVFGQVAELLKNKIPLLFHDCKEELIKGHVKYTFENSKI